MALAALNGVNAPKLLLHASRLMDPRLSGRPPGRPASLILHRRKPLTRGFVNMPARKRLMDPRLSAFLVLIVGSALMWAAIIILFVRHML